MGIASPPRAYEQASRRTGHKGPALDLMRPGEDWRNLPDSAERRKIQNRIAQRSYRRSMQARKTENEKLKQQLREARSLLPESQRGAFSEPSGEEGSAAVVIVGGPDHQSLPSQPNQELSQREGQQTALDDSRSASQPLPVTQARDLPSESLNFSLQQIHRPLEVGPTPLSSTSGIIHHPIEAPNHVHESLSPARPGLPCNNPGQPIDGADIPWDNNWLWTSEQTLRSSRLNYPSPSNTNLNVSIGSQEGSTITTQSTASENSILHLAIASGNCDVLELLLQTDEVSIDQRDAGGLTPLQRAVMLARADMVAILVDHGASLSAQE